MDVVNLSRLRARSLSLSHSAISKCPSGLFNKAVLSEGAKRTAIDKSARDGEKEKIHYVYSASMAWEVGLVFMSRPFAARQ